MIDLGLTKVALIGVVALVVIGPEKLPRVARMAGTLFGRAQRYINQVKSEVSREMELDELRQMQKDVTEAASSVSNSLQESVTQTHSELQDAWQNSFDTASGTIHNSPVDTPSTGSLMAKSKAFRKKCLTRSMNVSRFNPYFNNRRTRVISAAARVARFRPKAAKSASSFFS